MLLKKKFMEITIKEARVENLKDVFLWRNESNTIPWMADKKPVKFEDHKNWFNKAIKDSTCLFFVIYANDQAVGQIRYNLEQKSNQKIARVSMNITESMQGKGIGTKVFELGYAEVMKRGFAQKIQVRVHEEKARWIKKMELQGFKRSGETDIHGEKQIVLIG